MATYKGNDGIIKAVTTAGTPATIAEVTAFEITTESNLINDTAKGDAWETNKAGRKKWAGTISCHSNSADAAQTDLLEGEEVDLEVYVEGDASTLEKLTGTAIVASVTASSPEGDDTAKRSFSFTGNGALTRTAVA